MALMMNKKKSHLGPGSHLTAASTAGGGGVLPGVIVCTMKGVRLGELILFIYLVLFSFIFLNIYYITYVHIIHTVYDIIIHDNIFYFFKNRGGNRGSDQPHLGDKDENVPAVG